MRKVGLDQTTAWILAVMGSAVIFAGGYYAAKALGSGGHRETLSADDATHDDGHQDDGVDDGHGADTDPAHGTPEHDSNGHSTPRHGDEEPVHNREGHSDSHDTNHDDKDGDSHSSKGHGEGGGGRAGQKALAAKSFAAKDLPYWDYKGSSGPDHWGSLSEAFRACRDGRQQSPIDISVPRTDSKLLPVRFNYKANDVTVRNLGYTVAADFPIGSYMEIEGDRYDLKQLQVRSPSEHKVAGLPYDLEIQLTHQSADGSTAMLGLLFVEGQESQALQPIWRAMPHAPGAHPVPVTFDIADLLPRKRQFFTYQGSLTIPPCSEGIKWYVLVEPVELSPKQVDAFVRLASFNARPLQPLHGRRVSKSTR